jgi:type I restriction enzyme S subunit
MSLTIHPARIVEESESPLLFAPDSWPRRPLGEVATILNGFAFKSAQFVADGGTPLIRIRDLFSTETAVNYAGDYESRYVVRRGDLLVGMDGDFNCARWAGPDALLNQRVCKLTPAPKCLEVAYLTLILPGYLQAIHDVTSSTTVTHLSSRDIAEIPIPVPTLEEQRAVADLVSRIVEANTSNETYIGTARKALERFRLAVLAAACDGRLTADWRQTHPNIDSSAQELVDNIRSTRRKDDQASAENPSDAGPLPEGWIWVPVGTVVEVATGATPLRARTDYYGGDIPWVTSGATNEDLITSATEYISDRAIKETNAKVFPPGTLLVAMYGEGQTRGRVAELRISAATNQAVAALLFDTVSQVVRPYLRLFFLQNYERIRQLSFGGVQPNLSLGVIKATLLPLPPVAEQAEIVRRVEALLSVRRSVGCQVDLASEHIKHTNDAVLAKVLSGDLLVGVGA